MGGICCGDGGEEVYLSLYISGYSSVLKIEFTSSVATDMRYSGLFFSRTI